MKIWYGDNFMKQNTSKIKYINELGIKNPVIRRHILFEIVILFFLIVTQGNDILLNFMFWINFVIIIIGCIYFSKKRKEFAKKVAHIKSYTNKKRGVILECKKEINWLGTSIYPYKYYLIIKLEQGKTVKTDYLLDITPKILIGSQIYVYVCDDDVYLDFAEIEKTEKAI